MGDLITTGKPGEYSTGHQEPLSGRRRISQRNIYIVKAIELINRVTDKGESLSPCAIKTLAEKQRTR